ncbi:MAG: hypothetical protein IT517_00365 [Burkholderiales bacterium]|nr:hypothetical protein [Burkholderiales bacterium]
MPIGTAVRLLKKGEWQKAHAIVQEDASELGCWAHGIVHMLEGDYCNARYWYRKAHRMFPMEVDAKAEIAALATAIKESSH